MFRRLAQFPEDFRMPETLFDYREYVRFKFEFIAYIYKKWARQQIIGRPFDVFAWRANASPQDHSSAVAFRRSPRSLLKLSKDRPLVGFK